MKSMFHLAILFSIIGLLTLTMSSNSENPHGGIPYANYAENSGAQYPPKKTAYEVAADAAKTLSENQVRLEVARLESQERIAKADIASKTELETKRMEDKMFEFKVNGFIKTGVSFDEAMCAAIDYDKRVEALKSGELTLKQGRALLELDRKSHEFYLTYGKYGYITLGAIIGAGLYKYHARM